MGRIRKPQIADKQNQESTIPAAEILEIKRSATEGKISTKLGASMKNGIWNSDRWNYQPRVWPKPLTRLPLPLALPAAFTKSSPTPFHPIQKHHLSTSFSSHTHLFFLQRILSALWSDSIVIENWMRANNESLQPYLWAPLLLMWVHPWCDLPFLTAKCFLRCVAEPVLFRFSDQHIVMLSFCFKAVSKTHHQILQIQAAQSNSRITTHELWNKAQKRVVKE